MTHKYYDLLGVSKDCSKEDLKRAYKKMAIQHHPDKGGDSEKFKEISQAYQVLNDDAQRAKYDQLGDEGFENGGMNAPSFDPHSIFEQFFGGGGGFNPFFGGDLFEQMHRRQGNQRRKCRSVQHVFQLSNKEAYFGGHKTLKISIQKKCFKCSQECMNCQGKGMVNSMQRMGPFTTMATHPCHQCQGSGKVNKSNKDCSTCQGKCDYKEEKVIELHIPKGVEMGHQIKFEHLGEQPQSEGDVAGDLIFEIFVQPDPNFERQDLNLIYKTKITFKESILGKTITIPHYEKDILLDISEFGVIQPNFNYIVPNMGMKTDSKKGDLMVRFTIDYPTKSYSQTVKNQLKELL